MGASIMIIDADLGFSSQLEEALAAYPEIETTITEDGKKGLDLAHVNIPAAIILSAELEGVTGYTICNKLKKDDTLKSVPVVLISAKATPQTFENHKKLRTRAEEYLKKPFPPALLIEILKPYLGPYLEEMQGNESVEVADHFEPLDDGEFEEAEPMPSDGEMEDGPLAGAVGFASVPAGPPDDVSSEALTTVGQLDVGSVEEAIGQEPGSSDELSEEDMEQIRALQAEIEDLKRERDAAVSSASDIGSRSGASRELLALKKEKNAKEKEILDLRNQLNAKESERLEWSDREAELEAKIAELEDAVEQLINAKSAAESDAQASKAKAAQQEREAHATIEDLKGRLGEATAKEAELLGAVDSLNGEISELQQKLLDAEKTVKGQSAEIKSGRAVLEATRAQLEERESALSQAMSELNTQKERVAELESELSAKESALAKAKSEIEGLQEQVSAAHADLGALQDNMRELRDEREGHVQLLSRGEEIRAKALKAMDIAQALLREAGLEQGAESNGDSTEIEMPS